MSDYYTDREYGVRPRIIDGIDQRVWGGLYTIIDRGVTDGSFGHRYPEHCSDPGNENAPCGCDGAAFERALLAEVPFAVWPLSPNVAPDVPVVMDILEFCARAVGAPVQLYHHSYMRHHHLRWDREIGLARLVSEVNTVLARNGVAYELTAEGYARRLLPEPLAQALGWTTFNTGDVECNRLLETARRRIASPKPDDRQDAVEKLWDAFERLKTLEQGEDKKAQANAMLDRVTPSGSLMREVLAAEAKALTEIGNSFQIRHWEANKVPLSTSHQVDYLFMRMFAFLRLVLASTGRGG